MPTLADQLLAQLSMEQFDNLPSQCRHIEHNLCMKEFDKNDNMTAMITKDYSSLKWFLYA